jgi:hypothetical protein
VLLDANVLIALVVTDHVHHESAEIWFEKYQGRFATCPITEGSLIRLLIREGYSATSAQSVIAAIAQDARHEFWLDDLSYQTVSLRDVIGHRQVTDAYLAELARTRDSRVVSFDEGFAKTHPDAVALVPREI